MALASRALSLIPLQLNFWRYTATERSNVKVIIRTASEESEPLVLHTVPIRWDASSRRLLMLRAIGDGFYQTWPEIDVGLTSVDVLDDDVLNISVDSNQGAADLSKELVRLSALCQESYGHSRT